MVGLGPLATGLRLRNAEPTFPVFPALPIDPAKTVRLAENIARIGAFASTPTGHRRYTH